MTWYSGEVLSVDPERITELSFGGPYFVSLMAINPYQGRHSKSGLIYNFADIDFCWYNGRNATPREVGDIGAPEDRYVPQRC